MQLLPLEPQLHLYAIQPMSHTLASKAIDTKCVSGDKVLGNTCLLTRTFSIILYTLSVRDIDILGIIDTAYLSPTQTQQINFSFLDFPLQDYIETSLMLQFYR